MRTIIWWIRRDLRLSDNAALDFAVHNGDRVIALFIHDEHEAPPVAAGGASRWWLHGSIAALDRSLRRVGAQLCIRRGDTLATLQSVAAEAQAHLIVWNRVHEPAFVHYDRALVQALRTSGCDARQFPSGLALEPGALITGEGRPYRVFTAYWNSRARHYREVTPLPAPVRLKAASLPGLSLDELSLRPTLGWDAGIRETWQPGAASARAQLWAFCEQHLRHYAEARDHPALRGTSRLSPHLHFGELSARELEHDMLTWTDATTSEPYRRQLAWREFATSLLHFFPETESRSLNHRFNGFPWARDFEPALRAWQRGETGIPLVDAGMRELWHSGWMHNRVRMVSASLLTKNLLIPWQQGVAWFADTLVDADLANNVMGWQWVAGCGADAAPYFRVFNPLRQAQRFDPGGDYIRRWVPELERVPASVLHQPRAPGKDPIAALAGDYPAPIVDLAASRQRALDAYARHVRGQD